MKHLKSSLAATLLLAGASVLILQTQQATSQGGPPQGSSSFNAHYKEVDFTIVAGGTSPFIAVPVVDRAFRMVFSFKADGSDPDLSFTDRTFFYRQVRDELWADSITVNPPITLENFPDGFSLAVGLTIMPGTNGTFAIRTDTFTTTGQLHIGMWY